MNVRSKGLWLSGIGLVAVFATSTPAQEYRPGSIQTAEPVNAHTGFMIGPFLFSPSAKVGVSYDSNIFNVEDGFAFPVLVDPDGDGTTTTQTVKQRAQGGTVANGEARLALKLPFSHSYMSLTYVPQYRDYTNLETDRKFFQNASFETKLNFSSGSSLTLRDDYIDSFYDSRLLNSSNAYQLTSTPYKRNDATLDYDWSLAGFWGLAGRFMQTDFTADKASSIGFVDSNRRSSTSEYEFFDYVTQMVETRGYYNLSRVQVFASATFAKTDQDRTKYNQSLIQASGCAGPNPDPSCTPLLNVPDSSVVQQYDAGLGARGKFSDRTRGDVRFGYSWWRFENEQTQPYDGFSLLANLEHRFSQRTIGYVRLERSATQATGQFQGYYIREEANVRLVRQLSTHFSLTGSLTGRISSYPNSEVADCTDVGCNGTVELAPAYKINDYYGSVELTYRPGQPANPGPLLLTLQLAPRWTRSDLEAGGLDSEGQRLAVFIQYGWF